MFNFRRCFTPSEFKQNRRDFILKSSLAGIGLSFGASLLIAAGKPENQSFLGPDLITDDEEIDYALTQKGQSESGTAISRKSIAAFVAANIQNPDLYKNENLGTGKPIH